MGYHNLLASDLVRIVLGRESNPNVLQELLHCFQGIDGNIVKFDKETGFNITKDLEFEQSQIIYQLLELGFLFYCIKKLLESQQKCLVSKALAEVVISKLNNCYMTIADLESRTQERFNDRGAPLVILTHILPWARGQMVLLQYITMILEETKNMVGGAILNPILKYASHGNKKISKNCKELLNCASVPLYRMIWYWIVMGTIKDPYNEFFISENAKYARTKAWQCQFSLRKDYVPRLLEGMCAQVILDVGKCTHFINKFDREKAIHRAANKKGVFDLEGSNLDSLVNEDGKPVLKLRQMYIVSSKLVLDIMKSKYKLKDFFDQLHEYIFLRHGHFAYYFMKLMHPYLYEPVSNVPSSFVKKLLSQAMKACSHRLSDKSDFDNIRVHCKAYMEDDNVVDVFVLYYKMEGPIQIMFQIFDLSYRKIFMLLWKKNHVLYTLSNTWKLMRSLFKMKSLPAEVRESLQRLFTMNFQLMCFMNQVDFYVIYEVIGKYVKEFFEKLETTSAIDGVVDAHARMLRFILLGTLSEPEHEELRAQLSNIFSSVMEIEGLTMSVVQYVERLEEGYDDESLKKVFKAKVDILASNHEKSLKNFIVSVKSCKHADGLKALSDRIDCNEFYQRKQQPLRAREMF